MNENKSKPQEHKKDAQSKGSDTNTSRTPSKPPKADETKDREKNKKHSAEFKFIANFTLPPEFFRMSRWGKFKRWFFQITVAEVGMFLLTAAITGTGIFYTIYARKQWQVAQETLTISQRAYVTIGRKDGVIADFIVPKDPAKAAEIIIYFQNTGHLPAKFSWGTMLPFNSYAPGGKQTTGIEYVHPFKGLPARTRDTKTGAVGESGGDSTVIAGGDSILASTLGIISQKDLVDLPINSKGLLIMAHLEYCDELGNYSRRNFVLTYRPDAPASNLSFSLLHEGELPFMPPERTGTTERLFPCETEAERQAQRRK